MGYETSIVFEEYRYSGKKYDGAILSEGKQSYWVILDSHDTPWPSAPHHPNRKIARVTP